jgi:hypothetical protein
MCPASAVESWPQPSLESIAPNLIPSFQNAQLSFLPEQEPFVDKKLFSSIPAIAGSHTYQEGVFKPGRCIRATLDWIRANKWAQPTPHFADMKTRTKEMT